MDNEKLHTIVDQFHFLRPELLWFLVPAALVLILGLVRSGEKTTWQKHIAPHLRPFVINKGSERRIRFIRILTVIFLSLAILGLAGPTWKKIEVPGQLLETPAVILLDMSQSMMATDIQPNRLDRAKFKIQDFLNAGPRARTALVGYAGTAHTIVPLTSDYNIILNHLDGLKPGLIPVQGSNLEAALQLSDSITAVSKAPAYILLLSDDFDEESFSLLQNFVQTGKNSLEILPLNTQSGAEIKKPGSGLSYKDAEGNPVRSALDQEMLTKLQSLENIKVNALTLDKSDVEQIAGKISNSLDFQEKDQEKEDDWEDRGLLFTVPFMVLALFYFRKGWVMYSMIVLMTFTSCQSGSSFKDLWVSQDFQAQKLYAEGRYDEAAELYSDALHQGSAWFKAGEYQKAINAFKQDTTSVGAYNLGLALYKNGQFAQAARAFEKAEALDPGLAQAAENKSLMLKLEEDGQSVNPEDVQDVGAQQQAENIENKDMEDLGGGGQEATEEDMKQERKEETIATELRKGKEMEFVPEDFQSGNAKKPENILLQKVDDDPSEFLRRKFRYQLKEGIVKAPEKALKEW